MAKQLKRAESPGASVARLGKLKRDLQDSRKPLACARGSFFPR
jgi:hypothetical protein